MSNDKKRYEVISPLRRDGKFYKVGVPLALTEDEAKRLSGVVALEGSVKAPAASGGKVDQAGEDYAARLKNDLDVITRLRDEAAQDKADAEAVLAQAQSERDEAATDLAAAQKLREEAAEAFDEATKFRESGARDLETAKELRSKADDDRKAAEDALAKAEKLKSKK